MKFDRKALLEKIAAVQHDAWMHWSQSVAGDIKSPDRVERWKSYWVPYEQLDKKTQDLDREWAEKVMEIIEPLFAQQAKEMITKFEIDSNKYPTVADALEKEGIDPIERKKFKTTVENWINQHYPHSDISLIDTGNPNWFKLEVGDLIADGYESPVMEKLKDGLADLFWQLKSKKTYKTIEPNWWGPETLEEQQAGTLGIGLGQEDESDPYNLMAFLKL